MDLLEIQVQIIQQTDDFYTNVQGIKLTLGNLVSTISNVEKEFAIDDGVINLTVIGVWLWMLFNL
ncbi:MAG: hypothetical protein IPL22_04830 [Bacteroidetes bacterium]|nr:hypothetical protein [Bacteroidota bacterium]